MTNFRFLAEDVCYFVLNRLYDDIDPAWEFEIDYANLVLEVENIIDEHLLTKTQEMDGRSSSKG